MEKNTSRKQKKYEKQLKNNKKDTLQEIRVVTTRRDYREDINGSSKEESLKMKKHKVENKMHIDNDYDLITVVCMIDTCIDDNCLKNHSL